MDLQAREKPVRLVTELSGLIGIRIIDAFSVSYRIVGLDALQKTVEGRHPLDQWQFLLIAEPEVMSYSELQERLGKLIHSEEWPTFRIPKTVAKVRARTKEKFAGDADTFIKPWMVDMADAHYPVAIDRAQTLGWVPKHWLHDTLEEMTRRLKQDPRQWYCTNKLPLPKGTG
jgi:hypothetical protein